MNERKKASWKMAAALLLTLVPMLAVVGILASTQGADDRFIYIGLADAQKLFHHPYEITHVLVQMSERTVDPLELADCRRGASHHL
jgi:ABC-type lipoprotein release transport system permease subunit